MRRAIAAGLENAPVGVVTTPGTKKPKYVPAEQWPLSSSSGAMDLQLRSAGDASPHQMKVKNPAAPTVKREAADDWGR